MIFAKVQRLTGYVYTTPIADALQAAGITSDVDELTAEIQKVIKASNQGVDAVDQMTTVESEIPVNISVPANTKLTMTAQQVVTTVAYTFNIMSTSGSSYSVVVNTLVRPIRYRSRPTSRPATRIRFPAATVRAAAEATDRERP